METPTNIEPGVIVDLLVKNFPRDISFTHAERDIEQYFPGCQALPQIQSMVFNREKEAEIVVRVTLPKHSFKKFEKTYLRSHQQRPPGMSLTFQMLSKTAVSADSISNQASLEPQREKPAPAPGSNSANETVNPDLSSTVPRSNQKSSENKNLNKIIDSLLVVIICVAAIEFFELIGELYSATNRSELFYRFRVRDNIYIANLAIRQPVSNFEETLVEPYEYLRNSYTEIISYPVEEWMENKEQLLNFSKFPEPTGEDNEKIENFLKYLGLKEETAEASLFDSFFKFSTVQKYAEAEYYYYNKTYNLDRRRTQIPMCVVSTGRNYFSSGGYIGYFRSLSLQNYTNFKIFYIDDSSSDNSTEEIYAYVHAMYPNLRNKLTFVRNRKRLGAFMNKDSGMKENCGPNDIVIDLDGDDALVGSQTFNVLNAVYTDNPSYWVVYSNFLKFHIDTGTLEKGFNRQLDLPPEKYRREGRNWRTSHLKTYYMKLEGKIPADHLIEKHLEDDGTFTYRYSRYASDTIMIFSLLELAGTPRIKFLPEILYYYRVNADTYEWCHTRHQLFDEMKGRAMRPLSPLRSLDDIPQLMAGYHEDDIKLADYRAAHETCVD